MYRITPKDHDHIRHTKNPCRNLQIVPDMIHLTPRVKFMDNTHNKSELIYLLSLTFRKYQITVVQCDNDTDTSIVRVTLTDATDDSVEVSTFFYLQLFAWLLILTGAGRKCRFADNARWCIIAQNTKHPLFFTTSKGSYDVKMIREALSERQRRYLLFCHTFTDCDTVSSIAGHGPI